MSYVYWASTAMCVTCFPSEHETLRQSWFTFGHASPAVKTGGGNESIKQLWQSNFSGAKVTLYFAREKLLPFAFSRQIGPSKQGTWKQC